MNDVKEFLFGYAESENTVFFVNAVLNKLSKTHMVLELGSFYAANCDSHLLVVLNDSTKRPANDVLPRFDILVFFLSAIILAFQYIYFSKCF